MSLGLSNSGSAYINFKPSTGEWATKDGVLAVKSLLIDFDSVKTGWGLLGAGTAPIWQWDVAPGRKSAQPGENYKRGFSITVKIPKGDVYTWSSTGVGPNMGLDALHDQIAATIGSHPLDVCAVEFAGSEAKKIGVGQTRVPKFKFVKWVPRPEDMEAGSSNPWKSNDDGVAASDGDTVLDGNGEPIEDPFED